MVILGIDPGCICAGFAVIGKHQNQMMVLDYGCLKQSSTRPLSDRVRGFHDFFLEKITTHKITHLALETPFLGKNAQNFLKLGYLRGILYLLASQHQLEILEFAPMEVKSAVTGFGGASKDQVARIIKQLFPTLMWTQGQDKYDVTDALAVTLCGLWKDRRLVA